VFSGSFPHIDRKSQPKEIIMLQPEPIEIRREKVFIPDGLTARQISDKYGIHINTARGAKKKVSS